MPHSEESAAVDPREALIASLRTAVDAVPADPEVSRSGEGPGDARDPGAPESSDAPENSGVQGSPGDPEDPEYRAAKKRAYSILAMREHSTDELRKKLLTREHPPGVVEVLLGRLGAAGLLDDLRYARQTVRTQREQKGLSASALRRRLREKGVEEADVEAALDDLDDDFPHALALAQKKAASTRGLEEETRLRRILGVLGRRGFSGGVAMRAAREALGEGGSDTGHDFS